MKRITTAALSAVIAFTLIGCTPAEDPVPLPAPINTQSAEKPAEEEPASEQPQTVNPALDLVVGDCFNATWAEPVYTYEILPCDVAESQVLGIKHYTPAEYDAMLDSESLVVEARELWNAWIGNRPDHGYGSHSFPTEDSPGNITGHSLVIYANF